MLWTKLSDFVALVLGERRKSTYSHLQDVAWLSLEIHRELSNPDIDRNQVMAVSWLYGVSKPKYDADGSIKLRIISFLQQQGLDAELIMKIIERVSFSEKPCQGVKRRMWMEELGIGGLLVRDIVSDANMLNVLGASGYDKCINYFHSKSPELTIEEVLEVVRDKAVKSNLTSAESTMMTDPGKARAIPLVAELVSCLGFGYMTEKDMEGEVSGSNALTVEALKRHDELWV
jgi:hypothetical protein